MGSSLRSRPSIYKTKNCCSDKLLIMLIVTQLFFGSVENFTKHNEGKSFIKSLIKNNKIRQN